MNATDESTTMNPTRIVNLWLSNDEPMYHDVRAMAEQYWETATPDKYRDKRDNAIDAMSVWLMHYVEDATYNQLPGTASMMHDLLRHSLHDIDYRELAEMYIDNEIT